MLHQLYQGGGVSSEQRGLCSAFMEPMSICEPQSIAVRSKYSPTVITSKCQNKETGIILVPKLK